MNSAQPATGIVIGLPDWIDDLVDWQRSYSTRALRNVLGTVLWSGVRRLVYGADREDALRLHF